MERSCKMSNPGYEALCRPRQKQKGRLNTPSRPNEKMRRQKY